MSIKKRVGAILNWLFSCEEETNEELRKELLEEE